MDMVFSITSLRINSRREPADITGRIGPLRPASTAVTQGSIGDRGATIAPLISPWDKATLHLENGKRFVIQAKDNGPENIYVKSARLNRRNYSKTYITHDTIMKGGKLSYTMSDTPNKKRGTKPADAPYSMSTAKN